MTGPQPIATDADAPLTFAFEVNCSPEHAFDVWTSRIGTWWPKDHTVGGEREVDVILEPGVGGLIYERDGDNVEHIWGRITTWEPPSRLAFAWHIGRGPDEATAVEVRFLTLDGRRTTVEIEQRGWERFGANARQWRERNRVGWDTVLPHFIGATGRDQAQ
jgi:uncharacterized protein YndB with AHSA1/START domain